MKRRGHLRVVGVEAKRPPSPPITIVGGTGDIPPGLAAALLALMDKGRNVGRG